jgi:hypothetical protein
MQTKSPFKDNAELKAEINSFLRFYRTVFAQEAKRTSAFFELAAYNYLVRFYEANGYKVVPQNLKGQNKNEFIYALSPNAKPDGCSYFLAEKAYQDGTTYRYEIRHNLRVQSSHDDEIFVSPDYSVIAENSITSVTKQDYYNGKVAYHFVASDDVKSFGETKHYQPGPELVLNFVGLVNELMPKLMASNYPEKRPKHLGPSLFVSGVGNGHVKKIGASLAKRYRINVFLGLFAVPSQVYSASNMPNVVKIGSSW